MGKEGAFCQPSVTHLWPTVQEVTEKLGGGKLVGCVVDSALLGPPHLYISQFSQSFRRYKERRAEGRLEFVALDPHLTP